MELLLQLVERAGDLVSRDEIAARVWREDVFVDVEAGVRTIVRQIRRALGDNGRNSRFLETVAGKGYRFVAPVTIVSRHERHVHATDVPAEATRRHNVPADLTTFVGRQHELAALAGLVETSRLLTLTGPGGVGKTRLALRLAANVVTRFPDGVWMIDLGALTGPEFIEQTIATTLGLRESRDLSARQALVGYLRDRELLLVLDTCEHLVAAAAELTAMLLREASRLRIVATSREVLSVAGEMVFRVPSLSLPGERTPPEGLADTEAVRLFLDRATAAAGKFTATTADLEIVARVCERVEGIPLAIELAAARVVVLSLNQIESRLRDRFPLLAGGARTAVARQRTLEATIDWSYQLLSAEERTVLNRLSVFPASWTLEAAEDVCAGKPIPSDEMLQLLTRLVDKSLVVRAGAASAQPRYRLLDTLRDYAGAKLADDTADAVRARHFEYFWAWFRNSQPMLRGADQLCRLEELSVEHENVRIAIEWGLRSPGHAAHAVELAGAISWYWTKRGLFEEGKRWLARAVEIETTPNAHARAVYGLAHMHHFQGDQTRTFDCGVRLETVGVDTGDSWSIATGRFLQSLAAFELGDLETAIARARASLEAAVACGEDIERGAPLMILANSALARGAQDEALHLYHEAIDVHRRCGDIWGVSILLSITAGLSLVRGEHDLARSYAAEALAHCRALHDPRGIAWSLEVFAGLCAAKGDGDLAARLWGLSDSLLMTSGGAFTATIGWIRERHLDSTERVMGAAAFANARDAGRRWSLAAAMPLLATAE